MLKHIVLWRVVDEAHGKNKRELIQEIADRLNALPAIIEEVKTFEVGINIKPSDFAADLVLYSAFDDEEALGRYLVHPAHKEVGVFLAGVVAERRVVDFMG